APAALVIPAWGGLFFNVFAGWLLIEVYNRWSHGFFAVSGRDAHYQPLTPHETVFAVIAWAALVATCWRGVRTIWSTPREGRPHRRPPPRFVRQVSDVDGAETGRWPGGTASTRTLPVTLGTDGECTGPIEVGVQRG